MLKWTLPLLIAALYFRRRPVKVTLDHIGRVVEFGQRAIRWAGIA